MARPSNRTVRIVTASLLVLGLVWQHVQATRLGYELESSRRQADSTRGRIAALRMDLETCLSPAQLALHARTKLGMFPGAPESLRHLSAEPFTGPGETLLGRLFLRSRRAQGSPLST
jgi:hypothetical protein